MIVVRIFSSYNGPPLRGPIHRKIGLVVITLSLYVLVRPIHAWSAKQTRLACRPDRLIPVKEVNSYLLYFWSMYNYQNIRTEWSRILHVLPVPELLKCCGTIYFTYKHLWFTQHICWQTYQSSAVYSSYIFRVDWKSWKCNICMCFAFLYMHLIGKCLAN